ncbi:hypothetical protein OROHE_003248 [Orobanche hederae]
MGKNKAYEAMQRDPGSSSGVPEEAEDSMLMACGSFGKSKNFSYDYMGGVQKETKGAWRLLKGEMEADKERMMVEYRTQLDAERARKHARGSK